MNDKPADLETYRTLQLMTELEGGAAVSQRELAGRLGIAVGLVNSYLRNFVAKGYVRVKAFPRNRYAYLLTPKGIAEKSRLALQHINYFTNLYTSTRREYSDLFSGLKDQGVECVAFCGVDEVAEIAYLSLQEVGLVLVLVMDEEAKSNELFGRTVLALSDGLQQHAGPIIVTSLKRRSELRRVLRQLGVAEERILPSTV